MSDNSSEHIPGQHWYSMDLPRAIQITVWISLITVFVLSFLDLAGWAFHITLLKSILPQWGSMKIITALCFILAASGLGIIQLNLQAILGKILPRTFAFFICLVSLMTIYVYIFFILTGHEPSLTSQSYLGFFLPNAARMAFLTAWNFFLIGCALFLLSVNKTKASGIAHVMIIPVTIISYYVLVSYALGVYSATELDEIPVALNSGITFIGICAVILLLRPDTWLLKIFLSHNTAGIISRRLLPPLMVFPIVIGWARIMGERIGLYQSEEGVILVALTYTVCFLILIWITARNVEKIDKKRRSSEEALKESEEQYHLLFDGMSEGFAFHEIILDNNGKPCDYRFLSINPAFERLTGLKAENTIGKKVSEVLPATEQFWIDTYGKVALTGESVEFENYSSELNSYFRVNAFSPKKGHFAVIFENITNRIVAEKELQRTKNYLENLINYANAPIIVWNPDNKIQLFNHAFEHLTGYTSHEVIGKKLDLLFPKGSLKESNIKIERALTEYLQTMEIPILTKKKEIRTVLWNSANIYDTDNRTVLSTIAQGNDITERIKAERKVREAKEKLDLALENANIGIWEWNLKTDEMIWDERMEKIFGLEPGTFGKTFDAFAALLNEEDLSHIEKSISNSLEYGIPLETIFRIKAVNGKSKYISSKALVNTFDDKTPISLAGVCFDVTAMREGTEQLVFRLNEELLRSNKELEQFAYVASHDLQEPLRMISSFTQLLSMRYKDKLDNEAQEFIKYAVDGALRMQSLINALLEYSRVETRGKNLSVTDMHVILGQTINNLSTKIKEKNALITNDELPSIFADGGQMVQLFQNLISNALKFCNASPMIHISAIEEEDQYRFTVKDNGIGIEPQYFDRIFQIFQRLHSKEEYSGTGIGLAICKRIVERHGGKIWVESKPGEGTIFMFTIKKR